MCHHAGFRCGGSAWRELAAQEGSAAVRYKRAVLFCGFVLYVPFVCCSVKLPLSQPTSFCLFSFHSPPHPGGGRGGHVVLLLPGAAETRTDGQTRRSSSAEDTGIQPQTFTDGRRTKGNTLKCLCMAGSPCPRRECQFAVTIDALDPMSCPAPFDMTAVRHRSRWLCNSLPFSSRTPQEHFCPREKKLSGCTNMLLVVSCFV